MRSRAREARIPLRDAPPEGRAALLEVGGRRVCLYRVGGAFYALADRCPHRGAPLSAGKVAAPVEVREGRVVAGQPGSVVRCPWHKWEYEIATGRCLADARLRVRTYGVRVEGDELVVSLDRAAGAGEP